MKLTIAIVFAAAFLIATVVTGQQPPHPPQSPGARGADNIPNPPHPPPNPDPLAHLMFPPDMILGHARELNLSDEQKAFMRAEVQKATSTFQDLQ